MATNKVELEAKFWINSLDKLEERLKTLGAELVQERTFELNLRFDTPDRRLSAAGQVLRLRRDKVDRLTFKDPGDPNSAVSARNEIEVEVGDIQATREILEALGFHVSIIYEKYRAAYLLDNVEVSLDEMPFGFFSEIEGPDEKSIRQTAERLGLNWEARSRLSYLAIFFSLKEKHQLEMSDITFEGFKGQSVPLRSIGLEQAGF
jgi:adenylate cyclase class 2